MAQKTTEMEFLNAYEINQASTLRWPVNLYEVLPIDGNVPQHKDRGIIKNLMWQYRRENKSVCTGSHYFVIDVDESTVAVPVGWKLPDTPSFEGFRIANQGSVIVHPEQPEYTAIVAGLLREAIKYHFKSNSSVRLGDLWQDYGDFCQAPAMSETEGGFIFCRKFHVSPEILCGRRWMLQINITTKTLDERTIADYYKRGEVQSLAELIRRKRANRLTRKNEPTAIRVLCDEGSSLVVLELESPEEITDSHAFYSMAEQMALADGTIRCAQFNKPAREVPMSRLRLILDTQITQEEHSETIIDPDDRLDWYIAVRDFVHGFDAFGQEIKLALKPVATKDLPTTAVLPPSVRLRTKDGTMKLAAPKKFSSQALKDRAKTIQHHIREFGYLEQRPINPLLAYTNEFGSKRAKRMQRDLNWIIRNQGLDFRFGEPFEFSSVQDLKRVVQHKEHDTLLAVLPESSWAPYLDNDTHDRIKQHVPVPSQCIHHDNTLPLSWIDKGWREIRATSWREASRINQRYHQCILNLLVKHHWIPYAPADAFAYNVHVGIDVGGRHNTHVMACIGYGFSQPEKGLVFLPRQIVVDSQKAEPILEDQLYAGLLSLFEELDDRLQEAGVKANFNTVLFFRDGEYRGREPDWNELDALKRLHHELCQRGLIDNDAVWTATEVSKRASNWRVLRQTDQVTRNPVVGYCVFPFEDPQSALVCTTGSPYLSQGTASPLLVRIQDIYGESQRADIIRDLIWEADMCFTKIDTGLSLPWVLHVANTGALQLSKAYTITGVTV